MKTWGSCALPFWLFQSKMCLCCQNLNVKPVNSSMYTPEINQWQLMIGKWDLQTQAGAPDERRWVGMAGGAQIGCINERTLRLLIFSIPPLHYFLSRVALFWELPKASLKVLSTDLSLPSAQLCLWHSKNLWFTKGLYWSLNIAGALTLANSHISFVQLFLYKNSGRNKTIWEFAWQEGKTILGISILLLNLISTYRVFTLCWKPWGQCLPS